MVGLGYIGLPTAAVLASRKKKVLGVDVKQHAVDVINQGKIHIIEPDLDMLVHAAVSQGYLRATTSVEAADAFMIAVPTPFKESHQPDLSYIQAASLAIAPHLKKGNLVVLESTSPVGATEMMAGWLAEVRPDLSFPQHAGEDSDIRIAHCPERVLPGRVLQELVQNDRIIGGMTRKCSEAAVTLYKTFVQGECLITNARTAEMCKLTENSFRDVNIAFANELSMICDVAGINVWELISLANRHPRVSILQPGPGVGGHCIAVDPWFIVAAAPEHAKLIKAARDVNDHKPHWVVEKVKTKASRFKSPVIGCLGLAFKANIDDLRESPALDITRALIHSDIGRVMACEPKVPNGFGEFPLYGLNEVLKEADIIVVLVDHDEFKDIDREMLKEKVVLDTRGAWR